MYNEQRRKKKNVSTNGQKINSCKYIEARMEKKANWDQGILYIYFVLKQSIFEISLAECDHEKNKVRSIH